jgi:hypothetical protein
MYLLARFTIEKLSVVGIKDLGFLDGRKDTLLLLGIKGFNGRFIKKSLVAVL